MTLIVNLFGGPGSGKSTTRAGVFSKLKLESYNVEEVTEFAKELTWERRILALSCQPYIFGNQLYALHRLQGQVDAVVTDSPILLGAIYAPEGEEQITHRMTMFYHNKFNNINFFIKRNKPYNPAGRNQTLDEAKEIDEHILHYLDDNSIYFQEVEFGESGIEYIAHKVKERIKYGS